MPHHDDVKIKRHSHYNVYRPTPDTLGVFCYISKRIMTFFAIKKATSPTIAEFPLLHHAEKVYFPHYRVVYLQREYRNSHFPTPP